MSNGAKVFNSGVKLIQRANAMRGVPGHPPPPFFDYLRNEVSSRLVERLRDIKRSFPICADIGATTGSFARALASTEDPPGGIQTIIQVESCREMQELCPSLKQNVFELHRIQAHEEMLPLAPRSLDLVVSVLSLHWVNDLPGALTQIRRALKPDGCFIGALLGGDTLQELRSALILAEQERCGGISPHVSPMAHLRDCGMVLQRAGFALPTIDQDKILCPYPDMFTLMHHLQAMGENNAISDRRMHVPRDVFIAAAAAYEALYGKDGILPATFNVIYLIAWSPDPSQMKPAQAGSADQSIKEMFQ
jgi:NADH dehydrogenase [ubiquinone] 1 alpha subcomplex assembly factor 5